MESGVQSSFIPRDAAQPNTGRALKASFLDLVVLVSAVLFIASLVFGAGVFLYQSFLETSIKSKTAQLERAKAAFEPALILQLTRLDDRMRDADQILSNHIAPSVFLRMLERVTLSTVAFRSMSFEMIDLHNIGIKMDGVAHSVNSIALQADLFSRNGIITSPIFSNIDRQQDGVHFNLTALVNPSSIRYTQMSKMSVQGIEPTSLVPASSPVLSPVPAPAPAVALPPVLKKTNESPVQSASQPPTQPAPPPPPGGLFGQPPSSPQTSASPPPASSGGLFGQPQ